ncbi:unnamed protein product [Didymodactylos carnosus]|uniref:PARG catalytic Macro domain-containing protein n=1 Tax=Didymodactylos carnosus TaxID=1234261 RepID=A0A815CG45_9BILA|nr:unnamed protein product [Didymodactylos carnosus]CAF1326697.1 unnamed protein product [Didymodactylos carnosus]CAF4081159.1 unnamed protein product [Didymodactylos carnosus]CAF4137962.1 unnamed protein product [Didymodactylos carnosus]
MATSRFVDSADDYEKPHYYQNNNVQINAKSKDELKNQIFGDNHDRNTEKFLSKLENAIEFNGNDLFQKFPPKFHDKNKLLLYNTVMEKHKYVPSKDRSVLMTRWLTFSLPNTYDGNVPLKVTYKPDIFTYGQTRDQSTIEWYLNFANYDLFSYYSKRLLAQDELQVLECFQLASIREYLCSCNYSFSSRISENGQNPTPILISNVERILNMDTTNIYGNKFTTATEKQILDAYNYLNTPQIVNILAIEAPRSGQDSYEISEINYILSTCYTGFMAAKLLASKTHQLNVMKSRRSSSAGSSLKTIIHTGWFGCGAYGGNRTLMLILQIIASRLAQINEIVFHTLTDDFKQEIIDADSCVKELTKPNGIDIQQLIEHLQQKNFKWNVSDGT